MDTIRCIKCYRQLSESQFQMNRKGKRFLTCDRCRQISREWYNKNSDLLRERQRIWSSNHPDYEKEWENKNKSYRKTYMKDRWNDIKSNIDALEIYRNKAKLYSRQLREKFLDMYGRKCACCGEIMEQFLTIEHLKGQKGAKVKDISKRAYAKAIKEYRPDLYEVLCMNCNHAKSIWGICPHKEIRTQTIREMPSVYWTDGKDLYLFPDENVLQ